MVLLGAVLWQVLWGTKHGSSVNEESLLILSIFLWHKMFFRLLKGLFTERFLILIRFCHLSWLYLLHTNKERTVHWKEMKALFLSSHTYLWSISISSVQFSCTIPLPLILPFFLTLAVLTIPPPPPTIFLTQASHLTLSKTSRSSK